MRGRGRLSSLASCPAGASITLRAASEPWRVWPARGGEVLPLGGPCALPLASNGLPASPRERGRRISCSWLPAARALPGPAREVCDRFFGWQQALWTLPSCAIPRTSDPLAAGCSRALSRRRCLRQSRLRQHGVAPPDYHEFVAANLLCTASARCGTCSHHAIASTTDVGTSALANCPPDTTPSLAGGRAVARRGQLLLLISKPWMEKALKYVGGEWMGNTGGGKV